MIEYLPQALASLGAAANIVSSLVSLRDFSQYAVQFTQLQGHIIQANSHILSEQAAHTLLTTKIQELEKEIMRLKDWSAEKEHYSKREISNGIFAYIENSFMGELEHAHKLCCHCFDKTIKSTLQQRDMFVPKQGRIRSLICPNGCPDLMFHGYIQPA